MREIQTRLTELESEHGFRIVYACESGSRAWGFASADSDYDVRFIFVWPRDRYLGVSSPPDNYDLGVDEDLIDLSGWDLRKALRLFGKSNGAMVEWLHSPIVYREDSDLIGRWRGLTGEVFCAKANAAHYGGLAKNIWKGMTESGAVTAKKYLYALRATLAARRVIAERTPAPVAFAELLEAADLESDLRSEVDAMIAEKAGGAEGDSIGRVGAVDAFLAEALQSIVDQVDSMAARDVSNHDLDAFFHSSLEPGETPRIPVE